MSTISERPLQPYEGCLSGRERQAIEMQAREEVAEDMLDHMWWQRRASEVFYSSRMHVACAFLAEGRPEQAAREIEEIRDMAIRERMERMERNDA